MEREEIKKAPVPLPERMGVRQRQRKETVRILRSLLSKRPRETGYERLQVVR